VQLHVHTEWAREAGLAARFHGRGQFLSDFTLDEQTALIRQGLANLVAAGATDLSALRAGNMGGNLDTLVAAKSAGLAIDMSFDPTRGVHVRALLEHLREDLPDENACPTIPLSCVEDFPGHYRPAQLTALSFRELREALLTAYREHWPQFVILLHSFELVRGPDSKAVVRPHTVNLMRWNQLCAFLAGNRDRFVTTGCRELVASPSAANFVRAPRTSALHTVWRIAEQAASRAL